MSQKANAKSLSYMTKPLLVRAFSKKLGVSQAVAEYTIDVYQETILEALKDYDEVKIGDIIKIEKQHKPKTTRILNGREVTTEAYVGLKASMTKNYKKV